MYEVRDLQISMINGKIHSITSIMMFKKRTARELEQYIEYI